MDKNFQPKRIDSLSAHWTGCTVAFFVLLQNLMHLSCCDSRENLVILSVQCTRLYAICKHNVYWVTFLNQKFKRFSIEVLTYRSTCQVLWSRDSLNRIKDHIVYRFVFIIFIDIEIENKNIALAFIFFFSCFHKTSLSLDWLLGILCVLFYHVHIYYVFASVISLCKICFVFFSPLFLSSSLSKRASLLC